MAKTPKKKKQSSKIAKKLFAFILTLCLSVGYAVYNGNIQNIDDFFEFIGLKPPTVATMENSALVHFVDVGQGDCAVIQIDDKTIMIDSGESYVGSDVVAYLHSIGVRDIDLLIASHQHSDHIGGFASVIRNFKVKQLIMPKIPDSLIPDSAAYENVITAAQNRGTEVNSVLPFESYSFYGGVFSVIGPVREYNDLNLDSLIVQFDYGNHSFLFMGDSERKSEYELINSGALGHIDVLKVAHHGSKDATTMKFLSVTAPDYGVISCGLDNDYGHPHEEALIRLKDSGVKILTTSQNGNIIFETDGNNLIYKTEK